MEIQLIDMDLGESILISAANSFLLVDCGTYGPWKQQAENRANTTIAAHLHKKRKSIMVSHFHEDHYNCFERAVSASVIDCCYIPYIEMLDDQGNIFHPNPLDLFALRRVIEDLQKQTPGSRNWISFLRWLANGKQNMRIIPIYEGYHLWECNHDMRVYWPKRKQNGNAKEVKNLFDRGCYALGLTQNNHSLDSLFRLTDLEASFLGYAPNQVNVRQGVNVRESENLVVRIAHEYDNLRQLLQNAPVFQTQSLNHTSDNTLRRFLLHVKDLADNASIVFDTGLMHGLTTVETCSKLTLLTGDIKSSVLNKLCQSLATNHYYALKMPHHGTCNRKGRFLSVIEFDNLLISNGYRANGRNCGEICADIVKTTSTTSHIICTNRDPHRCPAFMANNAPLPICKCNIPISATNAITI